MKTEQTDMLAITLARCTRAMVRAIGQHSWDTIIGTCDMNDYSHILREEKIGDLDICKLSDMFTEEGEEE